MQTEAVILKQPGQLSLGSLDLTEVGAEDVVVEMRWSGISAGTEALLWSGDMPWFPGLEYPLVPGYEGVGDVVSGDAAGVVPKGTRVLVPGANCYVGARGLFGATASRVVVPAKRVIPVERDLGVDAALLSLAATAHHAIAASPHVGQTRVIGHGVVGRLITRLLIARGDPAPVVWETNADRRNGTVGYEALDPSDDPYASHVTVFDASGDPNILDPAIARLARGGEVVLAGFYAKPLSFSFPPAFMREARFRVAAEWAAEDMAAVTALVASGALDLSGLVTDTEPATEPDRAFQRAFFDPSCLKMTLDWSAVH